MGLAPQKVLLIDTETVGNIGSQIVYDIGIVVGDLNGKEWESYSFLVNGIFGDIKLMNTAHYSEKYPLYVNRLSQGESALVEWAYIINTIAHLVEKYDITIVGAYNENFDDTAMKNTTELFFGEGNTQWLPPNMSHLCIWRMACSALFDEQYITVARESGWVTDKNNVKTSAEMAYRYITDNPDFIEEHTGLEDCRIELAILSHIVKSGKPFEWEPKAFPMREVYEKDRVYKIADLEKTEQQMQDIADTIEQQFKKLSAKMKAVQTKREKLDYNEPTEFFTKAEKLLAKGTAKMQIAEVVTALAE